ncbi:hypothetical protein HRbin30_02141 [bacterium HR30]|nr:hypothetical protein HRbin30_02141 [bacterium HR30]
MAFELLGVAAGDARTVFALAPLRHSLVRSTGVRILLAKVYRSVPRMGNEELLGAPVSARGAKRAIPKRIEEERKQLGRDVAPTTTISSATRTSLEKSPITHKGFWQPGWHLLMLVVGAPAMLVGMLRK